MKKTKNGKSANFTTHGKPITRRDFISRGLIAGGGVALAPTLLHSILASQAQASDPLANAVPSIPFIVLDLAGGAALHANFLTGGANGPEDLLRSYSLIGWNPRATKLDKRFGIPMAGDGVSKVLEGILQAATPEAQSKFRMGSFLHTASIDTDSNPLSALSLVSALGVYGKYVTNPVGLSTSQSGGRSRYALEGELYRAFSVRNINDLVNATGFGGALSTFSIETKGKLGRFLDRLSNHQLNKILSSPADDELKKTLFANLKSVSINAAESSKLDPRALPAFNRIYGIDQNTQPNNVTLLRAGLVLGTLSGATGPAVITIDGCDYHDGSQTTGDTKDLEVGVEIGRIIQAAFELKTKVFIQIITDGGIYPREGSRIWSGDSTETCMSAIGYFDPASAPVAYNGRLQVGAFTQAQGADRRTLIGERPLFAAYGAFVNYLSASNRLSDLEKVLPSVFDQKQIESLLLF